MYKYIIILFFITISFLPVLADAPWYVVPVQITKLNSQIEYCYMMMYGDEIRGKNINDTRDLTIAFGMNGGTTEKKIYIGLDYSFNSIIILREGIILRDNVSLRKAPMIHSDLITTLSNNDVVKIINQSSHKVRIGKDNNYWYKIVLLDGKIGWCYGKYLKADDSFSVSVQRANKTFKAIKVKNIFYQNEIKYIKKLNLSKDSKFLDKKTKFMKMNIDNIIEIKRVGEVLSYGFPGGC